MEKKIYKIFATLVLVSILFSFSGVALAKFGDKNNTSTKANVTGTKNFCSNITNSTGVVEKNLADKEAKLLQKKTERESSLAQKRNERDAEMLNKRNAADDKRDNRYSKLEELAKTDAQKAAVVAFKTAVEAAINARKAAIDKAKEDFRAGIDKIIAERKSTSDALVATFKASVEAATSKAKTDCAVAGADPQKIRSEFQNALKVAKEKLATDRKALDNNGEQIKALTEIRNTAYKTAKEAFQVAMEKARNDLKTALGATQ